MARLASSFAAVPTDGETVPEQIDIEQVVAKTPAPHKTTSPAAGRKPQKMGKVRNPDFKRLTILVRKDTENAALRLLMDEREKMDLSDLVEKLLSAYVHKSMGR